MREFPCVRQRDAFECGAACLATMARSHGVTVRRGRARRLTRTGAAGTTVLDLVEGARQIGFDARAVRGPGPDAIERLPLPWIAHLASPLGEHFVVVHRVSKEGVIVGDPAEGVRRIDRRAFNGVWSGVAILMAPACRATGRGGVMSKRGAIGLTVVAICAAGALVLAASLSRLAPPPPLVAGEQVAPLALEPLRVVAPPDVVSRRAIVVFRPSCPHCATLLATLARMRFEYWGCFSGQSGVQWMFVSTGSRQESLAVTADLDGFPLYLDTNRTAVSALRVSRVPAWVVTDARGVVESQDVGQVDEQEFRRAVDRICDRGR